MSFDEKKQILEDVFNMVDKMNEPNKIYILGYIQGFEDKSSIYKINNNKQEDDKTE